jgi:SAM-dependent methyltransferase
MAEKETSGNRKLANMQNWSPDVYEKNARYVSELGLPIVQLLNPQPGERILDLGCGDGTLTKVIAGEGCDVVGVDSSSALVAAALKLGLCVDEISAYDIAYQEEFDAVFSNAALHWMTDADRVIEKVYEALRPGGRFVGELGGHKNCKTIQDALVAELERRGFDGWSVNPWYFPTEEGYRTKLQKAGFVVRSIQMIPRPTPLPEGMLGFLETFAGSFASVLRPDEREEFLVDVCRRTKPSLCDSEGQWVANYRRLRFEAHKPGLE